MKNLLLLSCLALFILACSEKRNVAKEVKITRNEKGITTITTTERSAGDTLHKPEYLIGKVKLEIKRKHIFSDPIKTDEFALNLSGKSLPSGHINFTITNPQGQVIYRDSMLAADLEASMVYTMKNAKPTEKEREDFIKKRLNEFFDPNNFSTPAIAPNDSYDPAFGDEPAWNGIKNDKNAVGFSYLVGKENGRRIAYSKLKKKVMLVGNFGG